MRSRQPRSTLFPYTTLFRSARLGSQRLNRKHLLQVNGRPLLQYLIDRIRTEFKTEFRQKEVKLAIATSVEQENKDFELLDRKSTRLNSSHRCISYAVFCLKK